MSTQWENSIVSSVGGTVLCCIKCKTETPLYMPGEVQLVFCTGCRSVYSRQNQSYAKIKQNPGKIPKPLIPLYTKCRFNGEEYTVIGYARKREIGGQRNRWEEYSLIGKDNKIIFLSQAYGHWALLYPTERPKNYDDKTSSFINEDSLNYELLASYHHNTETALGQFYYDVIAVDKRLTREFTNPPHMFSCEEFEGKKVYFQGIYLKQARVREAFEGTPPELPEKEGVGDYQPFYLGIKPRRFALLSLLVFILCTVVQLAWAPREVDDTTLLNTGASINDSLKVAKVVTGPFEITGERPAVLRFDCGATINNDWIEGAVTLINESTGEEQSFVCGLEYYSGSDDEGFWSEGSTGKTEYIDQVKPGRYHVELEVSGAPGVARWRNFNMGIVRTSAAQGSYWLLMAVYAFINIIVMIAGNKFEDRRAGE